MLIPIKLETLKKECKFRKQPFLRGDENFVHIIKRDWNAHYIYTPGEQNILTPRQYLID